MPGPDPIRAGWKILDRKDALEPGNRIVRIVDSKPVSQHVCMHTALHDDAASVSREMDDVTCPRLGKRRPVEHDEHVFAIPFIDLQIMRDRVEIFHGQEMKFPHDRYEWDELTDVRLQLRFRKLERFAFLNAFDRHDHIFQSLLTSDRD